MHAKHEVLVLHKSTQPPNYLMESLQPKGYPTRLAFEASEVTNILQQMRAPIFVLDYGKAKDVGAQVAQELLALPILKNFPVVILGQDSGKLGSILAPVCGSASVLEMPYRINELLSVLEFASSYYIKRDEVESRSEQPATTSSALELEPETQPVADDAEGMHHLFPKEVPVPEILFSQMLKLGLTQTSIGGDRYSTSKIDEAMLRTRADWPTEPVVLKSVKDAHADIGRWARLHSCRVLYISCRIAEALNLPSKVIEVVRIAALLYAWGFADDQPELLRKDYPAQRSPLIRKEICSKIKDSAMRVATELENPQAAKVISTLARLIGQEAVAGEDSVSIVASTIMAADFIDRLCFAQGYWNPRAANTILRRIKRGTWVEIHPRVLGCIVKFLSEAVGSHNTASLVPQRLRKDPELLRLAKEHKEQSVSSDEVKVPITSLEPGMTLSRPLFAFDGRKILSEKLILDQDLIWRLWQLSAVRPLNAPLVVKSDEN